MSSTTFTVKKNVFKENSTNLGWVSRKYHNILRNITFFAIILFNCYIFYHIKQNTNSGNLVKEHKNTPTRKARTYYLTLLILSVTVLQGAHS